MTSQVKENIAKMRGFIEDFPRLLTRQPLQESILKKCQKTSERGIKGVCLLGMGGSSIANQYVIALLKHRAKIPLFSIQNYSLPAHVTQDYVVIAVSYSGNTAETLSAFLEAKKRECEVFSISSGGKLGEISAVKSTVPVGMPPRAALPLLLSKVLPMTEILSGQPTTDLSIVQYNLEQSIQAMSVETNLAQQIKERIPLFMGAEMLAPVAYRAKCQINENAKQEAFFSLLPEANHNELEGFSREKRCELQPIFLRLSHESTEINRRMRATMKILDDLGYTSIGLHAPKGTHLEQMLTLTWYLDRVSVRLAELNDVDPIAVPKISLLKKKIK